MNKPVCLNHGWMIMGVCLSALSSCPDGLENAQVIRIAVHLPS